MPDVVTFDTLNYEVASNGVAIVTIDVKDRPMNVLTPELHRDVGKLAEQLASDDSVIGAVIQSGKPSFMAGGDLKRIVGFYDMNRTPEEAYQQSRTFTESLRKLETCGKPVAVIINGAALGGGLELALACHYRVLLDGPKIPLGLPETTLGLLPGAGGTQRLPRLIGIKAAARLILSGKHITPAEALELGIVDKVVAADEMFTEAQRWVLEEGNPVQPWDQRGFQVPGGARLNDPKIGGLFQALTSQVCLETKRNYPAPIAALRCLFNGTTVNSLDLALQIESREFSALTRDPVARNMIRTLFLNKSSADKLANRPPGVEKATMTKVVLLGDSSQSPALAYTCALSGIEVFVHGNGESDVRMATSYAAEQLEHRVAAGKTTQDKADALLSLIKGAGDNAELEAADLVVVMSENVLDELAEVISHTPASAIIAINTPALSLDAVVDVTENPEQIIGWHIGAPADLARAVEIVMGGGTTEATLAGIMDFSRQLRKTPTIQQASPQLFSQHCVQAYLIEGLRMLGEGVNPALIENAAMMAGLPNGPLALADEMSLTALRRSLPADAEESQQVLGRMIDAGHTGKSVSKGFYDYSADGGKTLLRDLAQLFQPLAQQPDVDQVRQRLMCSQALSAAHYWEAGLIEPIDADLASVLCWGFPSYAGGVLSYIDTLGVGGFISQCEQLVEQYGVSFEPSDWLREYGQEKDRIYPKVV